MNKLIIIVLLLYCSSQCLGNVASYRAVVFPKDDDYESGETNARTALNNYNFEEEENHICGHDHSQHGRYYHQTHDKIQHDPEVHRRLNIPYPNGGVQPNTNILIPQDYYQRPEYNTKTENNAVATSNGVSNSYASPHDYDDNGGDSSSGKDDSNSTISLRTVFVAPKNCKRMTATGRCLS